MSSLQQLKDKFKLRKEEKEFEELLVSKGFNFFKRLTSEQTILFVFDELPSAEEIALYSRIFKMPKDRLSADLDRNQSTAERRRYALIYNGKETQAQYVDRLQSMIQNTFIEKVKLTNRITGESFFYWFDLDRSRPVSEQFTSEQDADAWYEANQIKDFTRLIL